MSFVVVGAVAGAASVGLAVYGNVQSEKAGRKQQGALKAQGIQVQKGKYFAAKQMEIAAGQQQAVGQIAAAEEIKKAELLQSRALAIAGASGASASDPNFTKIMNDIGFEGEIAAQNQLYNGDETARAMRVGAKVARWEGDMARQGYNVESAAVNDAIQANRIRTVLDIAGAASSWAASRQQPQGGSTTPTIGPGELG